MIDVNLTTFDKFLIEKFEQTTKPSSLKRFMQLSEDKKAALSGNLVERLVEKIKARKNRLDLAEIEQSRGDFDKLRAADYIRESILFINDINRTNGHSNEVENATVAVDQAIYNLLKFKSQFINTFNTDDNFGKMIYNSIVYNILLLCNILVSYVVKYIKDTNNSTLLQVKDSSYSDISRFDIYKDQLVKFNKIANDGSLNRLFKNENLTSKILDESTIFVFGTVIGLGLLMTVLFLSYIIRFTIYTIFYSRIRTSELTKNLADFVEENADRLDPNEKARAIEKQRKIVIRLRNFSRKLNIELNSTEQKVASVTKSEDRELYKEASKDVNIEKNDTTLMM